MKTKIIIWVGIIIVIITGVFYINITSNVVKINRAVHQVHEHADFKVYINNIPLNFSQEKYILKDRKAHIENMDGITIHKHTKGMTLEYFFKTLGFEFNESCFILDTRVSYCNEEDKKLKFYVNGVRNFQYEKYEIKDSDKYLISYGNENEEEIQKQLDSI